MLGTRDGHERTLTASSSSFMSAPVTTIAAPTRASVAGLTANSNGAFTTMIAAADTIVVPSHDPVNAKAPVRAALELIATFRMEAFSLLQIKAPVVVHVSCMQRAGPTARLDRLGAEPPPHNPVPLTVRLTSGVDIGGIKSRTGMVAEALNDGAAKGISKPVKLSPPASVTVTGIVAVLAAGMELVTVVDDVTAAGRHGPPSTATQETLMGASAITAAAPLGSARPDASQSLAVGAATGSTKVIRPPATPGWAPAAETNSSGGGGMMRVVRLSGTQPVKMTAVDAFTVEFTDTLTVMFAVAACVGKTRSVHCTALTETVLTSAQGMIAPDAACIKATVQLRRWPTPVATMVTVSRQVMPTPALPTHVAAITVRAHELQLLSAAVMEYDPVAHAVHVARPGVGERELAGQPWGTADPTAQACPAGHT